MLDVPLQRVAAIHDLSGFGRASLTVVIPILNIYGTGRTMQAQLPGLLVTDGCIYISSNLAAPGVIQRHGSIFRVIFGTPDHRTDNPVLCQVAADLTAAGIDTLYSPFVEKDTLLKFSHVSPMAACGQYYHVKAGAMQKPGESASASSASSVKSSSLRARWASSWMTSRTRRSCSPI